MTCLGRGVLAAVLLAGLIGSWSARAEGVRPFSQLTATAFAEPQGYGDNRDNSAGIVIHVGPGQDRYRDRDSQDRYRDRDANAPGGGHWGGWGGFGFGIYVPTLQGFDALIDDRGLYDDFPVLDTWSGRGFVSYDNWRFGGSGGIGHYHLDGTVQTEHRSVSLNVGWIGVSLDYLLPVGDRVGIFGGGMLGGGGATLSARGEDLPHDLEVDFTGFRFFAPEVGISILTIPWVRVEATAQYMLADVHDSSGDFVDSDGHNLVDTESLAGPIFTIWFLFGHD